MQDAYFIECRWWVAVILVSLSTLADIFFKASQRCHALWVRTLFRLGNRDQLQEYHRRYDNVLRVLEGEDLESIDE